MVLMITAFASVETAIQAMKKGAFDYVTKPFKHEEVLHILRNGAQPAPAAGREPRSSARALRDQGRFTEIVGKSPRMQQVFGLIAQAAPSRSTILVVGESGTGKELVAKAIHANSPRADKAFIVVNSGSLPHDLLESNLFGHVKGAFTGAVYAKKGLFELADKGTLFFDEIGNIPLETQAKLLRVMQEREFMRLGGVGHGQGRRAHRGRHQHRPAPRGGGGPLPRGPLLPAERHRHPAPAAAPAQGGHPRPGRPLRRQVRARERQAGDGRDARRRCRRCMDYDWPGNVRELENVIERGVVLTTGDRDRPRADPRPRAHARPASTCPHMTRAARRASACATSSRASSAG